MGKATSSAISPGRLELVRRFAEAYGVEVHGELIEADGIRHGHGCACCADEVLGVPT